MANMKINQLCGRCTRKEGDAECLICDRGSRFIEARRGPDVRYDLYCKGDFATARDVLNRLSNPFAIKKVIFNEPVTVVMWADGTKTIVRCQENDIYDPEKGMAMAIAKKALGNKGNYCEVFKKWVPEEKVDREFTFEGIIDGSLFKGIEINGGTISFDVKR